MKFSERDYVPATEICALLGISAQTLYAYVSRGLVRAIQHPGDARKSLYLKADAMARIQVKQRGRSRRKIARSTLSWGEPLLESSITRISDGHCFYRGQNVVDVATGCTLEQAAELLLNQQIIAHSPQGAVEPPSQKATGFGRMLSAMSWLAGLPVDAASVAGIGLEDPGHLLRVLTAHAIDRPLDDARPAHVQLGRAWGASRSGAEIIRKALVLCADHELNASAFATRVAASTGATLPACLVAGLATLSGPKHGGMVARVEAWMKRAVSGEDVFAEVAKTGRAPGFGHPLYPGGDPRALAMIGAVPLSADWQAVSDRLRNEFGLHASLDFGLAHIVAQLKLPPESGLLIFALGRSVGWMAHVMEQRQHGRLIRPRAYGDG